MMNEEVLKTRALLKRNGLIGIMSILAIIYKDDAVRTSFPEEQERFEKIAKKLEITAMELQSI